MVGPEVRDRGQVGDVAPTLPDAESKTGFEVSAVRPGSPFLLEVVGAAGSGKSTVARLLCEAGQGYRPGEFIHTRNPRHLLHLARSVPALSPMLAANLFGPPRLSWPDFKLMVYVARWHDVYAGGRRYAGGITVLDQGPLYALVRLRAQGRAVTTRPSFQRWWDRMLARWSGSLSGIVWLDAPDEVLLGRIGGRAQSHVLKGVSADSGRDFLNHYRSLFQETLALAESLGAPVPFRFDTSRLSPTQVAEAIRVRTSDPASPG